MPYSGFSTVHNGTRSSCEEPPQLYHKKSNGKNRGPHNNGGTRRSVIPTRYSSSWRHRRATDRGTVYCRLWTHAAVKICCADKVSAFLHFKSAPRDRFFCQHDSHSKVLVRRTPFLIVVVSCLEIPCGERTQPLLFLDSAP